jgi:hypothetical protein
VESASGISVEHSASVWSELRTTNRMPLYSQHPRPLSVLSIHVCGLLMRWCIPSALPRASSMERGHTMPSRVRVDDVEVYHDHTCTMAAIVRTA